MSETDEYILDAVRVQVWSGFSTPADVHRMIDDILEEDADEALLRAAVGREFEAKAAAEASWPMTTDCDRLDRAFEELSARGIIALQNAGITMSDGLDDVGEALRARGRAGIRGYCFYHGQDLERAVDGAGLFLAFGDLDDDKDARAVIGHLVKGVLERHGFTVEWDGDSESRLRIPNIDWKRRLAA